MTGMFQAILASTGGNRPRFVPDTALNVLSENPASPATTTLNFETDGSVTRSTTTAFDTNTGMTQYMDTVIAGAGTGVSLRITVTAGTFTTGSTGVWLALSSIRTFTKGAASGVAASVTFTIELSIDGGATVYLSKAGNVIGCTPL